MKLLPESWLARLPSAPTLFRPAHPTVAVEIAEDHVAVVRAGRDGLAGWSCAALPPRAVRSSPVQQNLADRAAVLERLVAARERLAPGGAPAALALPDVTTRISLVAADGLPRRREELRELVSWRVKKSVPFRMEEAELSWQLYPGAADAKDRLLAVVVRRRVLAEYESVMAEAGLPVGSAVPASLLLAERLPEDADGDQLLLTVGPGWFSLLISTGRQPLFHRCKPLPEAERTGPARDAFIRGELFPTLEYYRDRLDGRGLGSLWLHVAGGDRSDLEAALRADDRVADLLPARVLPGLPPAGVDPAVADEITVAATLAHRGRSLGGAALGGAA